MGLILARDDLAAVSDEAFLPFFALPARVSWLSPEISGA
jgi:hypothetical protein